MSTADCTPDTTAYLRGMEHLVEVVQELSLARDLPTIQQVVRTAARRLVDADGATFVLREGDCCHYADEDAIAPLWKGSRFPMDACVSGWVMRERQAVVIPDIYADARVPAGAYRPTFVKSMVMVPIRASAPIGAIGAYWATPRGATAEELRLLQALADSTSVAMESVAVLADLEEAIRARDAFLKLATHELNTPLTSLLLNLQGLAERLVRPAPPSPTDLRRKVDAALRGTLRLHAIVSNLLDLTRLRSGALALERQPVDLAALARDLVTGLADQARVAGCAVDVDAPAPVVARVDRARLAQALENLLTNALRFAAGAPVRVAVQAVAGRGERAARARVEVLDGGPGVPEAVLPRLFDEFQAGDTARQHGRLGLGLFIARGIVREHGGELTASNRPGGGAAFELDLPL